MDLNYRQLYVPSGLQRKFVKFVFAENHKWLDIHNVHFSYIHIGMVWYLTVQIIILVFFCFVVVENKRFLIPDDSWFPVFLNNMDPVYVYPNSWWGTKLLVNLHKLSSYFLYKWFLSYVFTDQDDWQNGTKSPDAVGVNVTVISSQVKWRRPPCLVHHVTLWCMAWPDFYSGGFQAQMAWRQFIT